MGIGGRRWRGAGVAGLLFVVLTAYAYGAEPVWIDFDAAIVGVNNNPAADGIGNGLGDGDELALLAAILADPNVDLSSGTLPGQILPGVNHDDVHAAWNVNQTQMAVDAAAFPEWVDVLAGYMTLGGEDYVTAIVNLMSLVNVTIDPMDYDRSQAAFLAYDGDADGDGFKNWEEYHFFIGDGRAAYLAAALDSELFPPEGGPVPNVPVGAPAGSMPGLLALACALAYAGRRAARLTMGSR